MREQNTFRSNSYCKWVEDDDAFLLAVLMLLLLRLRWRYSDALAVEGGAILKANIYSQLNNSWALIHSDGTTICYKPLFRTHFKISGNYKTRIHLIVAIDRHMPYDIIDSCGDMVIFKSFWTSNDVFITPWMLNTFSSRILLSKTYYPDYTIHYINKLGTNSLSSFRRVIFVIVMIDG